MPSFFNLKAFILSEARNRLVLLESISDRNGKMHENLVHKFLSGDTHTSVEAKNEHDTLRSQMSDSEYNDAVARAKHAADHIQKTFIGNKKILGVERTSKPGQTGESQSDNPSDLVIHHEDGTKTGLSLKTSNKKGAKVPISNPGIGTLQKYTNIDSSHTYKDSIARLNKRHPHTKGMTVARLKTEIKSNPEVEATAKSLGDTNLTKIVNDQAKGLDNLSSQDKASFIRKEVLRSSPTSFPVHKVETTGSGTNISTTHSGQNSHDHILDDHENISHRVSGNSIVFSHPLHGDFARIRFKYESRFGSSIKGSGELMGKKK